MNKSKILISFVLAISLFLITSISLVKPSYAASCVVSWSVSNKSPAANTEINVSVTQQPGQSSGVNWTNVHLYLDNTQDGLTFVNFDSGSRTSNYKANSRSAGSHTLKFTTDNNAITCTPQESFTTSGGDNSSSPSKIYIDPEPMEPGQSVTLTATAQENCSYDLTGSEGKGFASCEAGGGGTCDKNKPHNISGDSNPCWWRWKCKAGSKEGEYKATFDIRNPPSSGACYAEKIYKVAAAVTTKCYRMAENKADLKTAECKEYKGDGMEIDYDFKTPGQKFIFVEFEDSKGNKGGCGEKKDQPCQAEIKVLGSNPVITSCSLSFEGNNTILNLTADKDKGFGSDKGKVKSGDKELGIKKWKNDNVQVIWTDSSTGEKIPVVLTNSDGQDSEEVQCSAVSQLSLGAKVFCRAPSSHDTDNVELVLAEAFEGGKKIKQKIKIDKDGVVQGLSQKLEAGKRYKISLKAPKSLRKTREFTAEAGTTTIPNFILPVGDIFPVDGGDGAINSSDKAELNRQWVIAGSGSGRTGDFNEDGKVNSFDWACMRHDSGKSDDAEPEPESEPSGSPSPSQSTSAMGNFKAVANQGAYTFTWDKDSLNTAGYMLRFNKDPQNDWTGPGDFVVSLNSSASGYTTGDATNVTNACYFGTSHEDIHCNNCTDQASACQTTGVFTGFNCNGSFYNVSLEDLRDHTTLKLDKGVQCTALSAPANIGTACGAEGQITLSWDAVAGAVSYFIRLDNKGTNSPSWIDYGDITVYISSARACSGGKCQFTTGPNSYGDISTGICLKTESKCDASGISNGPAKLLTNTTYDWTIQALAPGEPYPWQGAFGGAKNLTCP